MNRRFPTLFLLFLLVATACGPSEQSAGTAAVEVRLLSDPDPIIVGEAKLSIVVSDMAWKPLNGADVSVSLIAPDQEEAGRTRESRGVGAGRYEVIGAQFGSEGRWTVRIRVDVAGGTWIETDRTLDVEAVAPGD